MINASRVLQYVYRSILRGSLSQNLFPNYEPDVETGVLYSFTTLIALFFPAFTDIMTGKIETMYFSTTAGVIINCRIKPFRTAGRPWQVDSKGDTISCSVDDVFLRVTCMAICFHCSEFNIKGKQAHNSAHSMAAPISSCSRDHYVFNWSCIIIYCWCSATFEESRE